MIALLLFVLMLILLTQSETHIKEYGNAANSTTASCSASANVADVRTTQTVAIRRNLLGSTTEVINPRFRVISTTGVSNEALEIYWAQLLLLIADLTLFAIKKNSTMLTDILSGIFD
jgi:hypothetical protein